MNVLEMIRNGGIAAMAAMATGVIGLVIGAIGFAVKGKSAVGIGVFTLLLGTLAAGLGIAGTFWGKHQTDAAIAMVNPVDQDLIRQAGYQESQDAGWVGFGASLLPLLFGFAHVLRARASGSAAPMVASLTAPVREESPVPVATAALVFGAIGVLAAVGALVMARQPLPKGKYDLARDDQDGWELARAVAEVSSPSGRGCMALHEALLKYCTPATDWPRVFAKQPPPAIDWRPSAAKCVEQLVHPDPGAGEGEGFTLKIEYWLESPLVYDARLRGLIQEYANRPNSGDSAATAQADPLGKAPAPAPEPKPTAGTLAPAEVARVVRAANPKFRACYEQGLKKNPSLAGKVLMHFVIGPKGTVVEAADQSNPPFPDPAVPQCILGQFRKLTFPKPSGGPVSVNFPFVFSAAR